MVGSSTVVISLGDKEYSSASAESETHLQYSVERAQAPLSGMNCELIQFHELNDWTPRMCTSMNTINKISFIIHLLDRKSVV